MRHAPARHPGRRRVEWSNDTCSRGNSLSVGRFDFKAAFNPDDRPLWLAQLAEAPAKLRAAVEGLNDSQLDTPYREGGWTLRQVVHHLADALMNWYIRPKLAVTEDVPVTKTYAEQSWSELADARTAPVEPSLRIFEGVTERWVIFLRSLGRGHHRQKSKVRG